MTKFVTSVESAASLAAGAVIAVFHPNTEETACLRRLLIGGREASSPGQVSVGIGLSSSVGSPGVGSHASRLGLGEALGNGGSSSYGNAIGVFSVDPGYTPSPLYELSFNTEGGTEKLAWEADEFACTNDVNNNVGFLLYAVNAVPSGFFYTVTFEVEVP